MSTKRKRESSTAPRPKARRTLRATGRVPRQAFGVFSGSTRGQRGDREEKKNLDTAMATSGIVFGQTTATVNVLNESTEGTSPTQHVGRHINMRSLFVRWEGHLAATTTGASPLRMLIVYDKQTNTALPATTQILVADAIVNPMNLANNRRFIVLMDEMVPCVGTAGPQSWMIEKFRRIDLPVEFNETNGGMVADIQTGGVYVLFYQDGGLLVANPIGSFYSRIRFTDA